MRGRKRDEIERLHQETVKSMNTMLRKLLDHEIDFHHAMDERDTVAVRAAGEAVDGTWEEMRDKIEELRHWARNVPGSHSDIDLVRLDVVEHLLDVFEPRGRHVVDDVWEAFGADFERLIDEEGNWIW